MTSTQETLRQNNVTGQYTSYNNLHITLALIGEFENVDPVLDAMKQLEFKPFKITLGGYISNFGNILWAGLKQNGYLEKSVRQLRRSLGESNIPFCNMKFKPPITLLRKAEFDTNNPFSISEVNIPKTSMTVNKILLMDSDIEDHVYTEVGCITAG